MNTPKTEKCFLRESDGPYTEITYNDLLRLEEQDSSFRSRFFLALEGGLLEVTEDVSRHFNRAERRARYLQEEEKRVGGVLSLDTETSAENPLHKILADANIQVEQAAESSLMMEQLHEVLSSLPENDRALIQALYFEGKTERECAAAQGVSQQAIHKQKLKILRQLKNYF